MNTVIVHSYANLFIRMEFPNSGKNTTDETKHDKLYTFSRVSKYNRMQLHYVPVTHPSAY